MIPSTQTGILQIMKTNITDNNVLVTLIALIAILIAVVMVIIVTSPLMLISQTKKIYSNFTGTYLHIIVPTELGKNKELVDIIYIVEETLFSFCNQNSNKCILSC
jgi:hypothetical protein